MARRERLRALGVLGEALYAQRKPPGSRLASRSGLDVVYPPASSSLGAAGPHRQWVGRGSHVQTYSCTV